MFHQPYAAVREQVQQQEHQRRIQRLKQRREQDRKTQEDAWGPEEVLEILPTPEEIAAAEQVYVYPCLF